MNFNEYLKLRRAEGDVRTYQITYVDMVKDLKAGILLTQIMYWFLPDEQGRYKTRVTYKGRRAIAKQRTDWFYEIRMTEREYDSAIKVLKHYGIVDVENSMFNAKRTPFIMINEDRFMELYKSTTEIDSVLQKTLHRNNTIRKTDLTNNVTPLTKSTTKNTTKITSIGNFDKQNPTCYFGRYENSILGEEFYDDDFPHEAKYYIEYYYSLFEKEKYTKCKWDIIVETLSSWLCGMEYIDIERIVDRYLGTKFESHSLYHSTLENVLVHRMQEVGLISHAE